MISVSDNYKQNIYDDGTITKCVVSYGAFDVTARSRATASTNNKQTFTSANQTIDAQNNFNKYTIVENGWILDGSVTEFPNTPTSSNNWGWWSASQSKADGTFDTNPTITYEWSENHTSAGLTIQANEPIFQMNIKAYNVSNSVIVDYNFTNTDADTTSYRIELGMENYRKIVITIQKILPYHYSKIQDVGFGIEYNWNDEIISLEVKENFDNKLQELESNQATITLSNIDNEFNKYNPNNKLKYLQESQAMAIYSSSLINNEWVQVPLGLFYLTSWGANSEYQMNFVANDILYRLSNRTYNHSLFYSTPTSARTIIEAILNDFGDIEYEFADDYVDTTLCGYIQETDYRSALQQVCLASRLFVKVNRSGKIVFSNVQDGDVDETIGYNKKMFASDEESERYNRVDVKQYTYSLNSDTTELFNGSITGNATITWGTPAANVTISGTYTSANIYACCIEIKGASGAIVVNGNTYSTSEKTITKTLADSVPGITMQVMDVSGIQLIATDNTSNAVATMLLNQLQKYVSNEFRWLSNPAIEIGDFVNVQVADNLTKKAVITSNKFSYNGGLSETTKVVL